MATPSVPIQLITGTTQYKALANGESIGISGNVTMVPGEASGKTFVMKAGSLSTTATTADQVVLTYTVSANKTFYLQQAYLFGRLDASIATATINGDISLEIVSGTKVFTTSIIGSGNAAFQPERLLYLEPIPIAAGTVVRIVCTPSSATARTWYGSLVGYEK